eukprot:2478808-Rhodomonas_salina.1
MMHSCHSPHTSAALPQTASPAPETPALSRHKRRPLSCSPLPHSACTSVSLSLDSHRTRAVSPERHGIAHACRDSAPAWHGTAHAVPWTIACVS